jgi:hypothetical protein
MARLDHGAECPKRKTQMKHSLKKTLLLTLASALLAQAPTAMATVTPSSWEVSGQFDYLNPPSIPSTSVWSYGWRPAPGNVLGNAAVYMPMLGTHISSYDFPFHRGWQMAPSTMLPLVTQNTRMTPKTLNPAYPVTFPARGVQLHPGYQCESAVVRFTAPDPAQYRVSGQFYGLDDNLSATQTQVRVISNTLINPNVTKHSGSISLPTAGQSSFTSKLVMLPKGGTLDFEVGCGPGYNYQFGSTGLHAVIEKTAVEYCEYKPNTPPNQIPC